MVAYAPCGYCVELIGLSFVFLRGIEPTLSTLGELRHCRMHAALLG